MQYGAKLSTDQKHRFSLFRIWDSKKPTVLFIGLNPSTADALSDDPTIRRCIRFAQDWGFGGFYMVNLFSLRATQPADMLASNDETRVENDLEILKRVESSGLIVCAWGTNGGHRGRDRTVVKWLADRGYWLFCLERTQDGYPKHPLYIKADTLPVLYTGRS